MVHIPMMESYLESVAGYVCDEDKLVTYKWLSKELEIHVNVAKIILWRYWEKYKQDQLVATFMLIGNLKAGGMRVEVVRDKDLSGAKEKFEKIISEHVYSLQKGLTSISLLAGSGKGDSRYSAIKCENSVVLDEEELLKMRWGKSYVPEAPSNEKNSAPNVSNKKHTAREKENNSAEIIASTKETPREKDSVKSTDQKPMEIETKNEEKPPKKISPPTKNKAQEKKGGIAKKPIQSTKTGFGNLFGKVANQQKPSASDNSNKISANRAESTSEQKSPKVEKLVEKIEKVKENVKSSSSSKEDKKMNENEKSSDLPKKHSASSSSDKEASSKSNDALKKVAKTTSNKKSVEKKTQKTGRGKKRERSRESDNESKKRKRIFVASDSSEDSTAASEEEDMFESPPSPAPEKVSKVEKKSPSPPLIKHEGNKRKVRKLVDKTFVDEDGFLITKKVHVYESCSEEEAEAVETAKKTEPEIPKDLKQSVKKKQSTLNDFFKKA